MPLKISKQKENNTIGENLRYYRKLRGFSQTDLGNLAFPNFKAPYARINKFESGIQPPSPRDIQCLAEILEITPKDLTNEQDQIITEMPKQYTVRKEVFTMLPKLRDYYDMINHAAKLNMKRILIETIKAMAEDPQIIGEESTKDSK